MLKVNYFLFPHYFTFCLESMQYFLPYFYYLRIKSLNIKRIKFHYYSFIPEISSLLELLNDDPEVHLTYYEHCSFIDGSLAVKANKIVLPNVIVKKYNEEINSIYGSNNIEAVLDVEYYREIFTNNHRESNDIIFISSGWGERLKHSKIN